MNIEIRFEATYSGDKNTAAATLMEKLSRLPSMRWQMGSEPLRHPDGSRPVLIHGMPEPRSYLNGSAPEHSLFKLELAVEPERGTWITYLVLATRATVYGPGLRVVDLVVRVQKLHDQGHYFDAAVYELTARLEDGQR